MTLSSDFRSFTENLKPDKLAEMETTVGEIAKKLNSHYYGVSGDSDTHMYIVGSVGRGTCIKGVSDLDHRFQFWESFCKNAAIFTVKNMYLNSPSSQEKKQSKLKLKKHMLLQTKMEPIMAPFLGDSLFLEI